MSTKDHIPKALRPDDIKKYFTDRLSRAVDTPRNASLLVAFVAITALLMVLNIEFFFHLGVTICIFASVAVALDLLSGYTGQVSIAHAGFMGIGAYTSAILTMKFGLPLWTGLVSGAVLATVVGVAIGYAAFRTSGHYFVLTTLAVAVLITTVFQVWTPVTGGASGITGILEPATAIALGGIELIDFSTTRGYFFIAIAYLFFTMIAINNVLDSRIGRAFIAVRENTALARSHGINTRSAKLLALALSCFFTGGAGSLYAHYFSFINPSVFGFFVGFEVLVMLIVGGLGSLVGPVVGAIFIRLVPEVLREYPEVSELVFGIAMLVVVLYFPGGIWGTLTSWWQDFRS